MSTTLPGAGFNVIQAPDKAHGIIVGNSGGATGLGQVDFSFDGSFFLTFFGANPIPAAQQASTGIPQNNMSSQLISYLTTTLAGTLGAPVPPNLAVPPQGYPNYP